MIITHPTYDELHLASWTLVDRIREANLDVDIVVGLVRGGTIPATIISHALDVPMTAIHYSSKDGAGDNKNHCNDLPSLPCNTNVLIVDDICDSGKTLQEVVHHYTEVTQIKHVIHTAVLYYKDLPNGFVPDFYWHKIPEDSPWIIFPFEEEGGNIGRRDDAIR